MVSSLPNDNCLNWGWSLRKKVFSKYKQSIFGEKTVQCVAGLIQIATVHCSLFFA